MLLKVPRQRPDRLSERLRQHTGWPPAAAAAYKPNRILLKQELNPSTIPTKTFFGLEEFIKRAW